MFNALKHEFVIEDRSQLIYALTEAASLEQTLMCQYLFAAASLKTRLAELTPNDRRHYQLERIRYWKRKITEVAREEMQHLAMVMNFLVAVGGSPTFARPNFPNENLYYRTKHADGSSTGLLMSLDKFSGRPGERLSVVDRFIRFERPQERARVAFAAIPPENTYDTVGQLYRAIQDALDRLKNVVIDLKDQYDPHDEDGSPVSLRGSRPPISNLVTTSAEARALIEQIIDQGEGYPGTRPDPRAHYEVFLRIRREFELELQAHPEFEPCRNVVSNPLIRPHADMVPSRATFIDPIVDGGLQSNMLQLFAGSYEVLIGWLGQLFSGNGRPDRAKRRGIETLTFLPYMSEVIAPLAELLTHIPTKFGEPTFLGPGFEVTSNTFLVPSIDVSYQMTYERLAMLTALANEMTAALRDFKAGEAASQLSFIAKTLQLTSEELRSRALHGWPPATAAWDDSYSEAVPDDFKYDFANQSVIELQFEGVFQCRLATDPDGANVPRGVTGNGFAIGDEPDLDRVIYFQPDGATPRPYCPPIGVTIHAARLLRKSLDATREIGEEIEALRGARIDLKEKPKFEGRNHVVSEDGEPIDPFVLEIKTGDRLVLSRRTIGIPINDMTPLQRRGSGRYPPSGANVSVDAMKANMAILSRVDGAFTFATPLQYTNDRITRLQRDIATVHGTPDEYGKLGAILEFRIRSLQEGLKSGLEVDARPIRWTRYFFDVKYRHFISGEISGGLGELSPRYQLVPPAKSNDSSRWLIEYRFGFFDTDAMCACVSGTVYLPVTINP